MDANQLQVDDRIRIVAVPGVGVPNYRIAPETIRAYKKLIKRKRSVRIAWIDDYGSPWFQFRFKRKNGTWEYHCMCVMIDDGNWVPVRHCRKPSRR